MFCSSQCLSYVILASAKRGTLYIGVTNDLLKRIYQHKTEEIDGFSKRYKVHKLVYYEETSDVKSALQREKNLKKWNREWKIELIEKENQEWMDLYDELNT